MGPSGAVSQITWAGSCRRAPPYLIYLGSPDVVGCWMLFSRSWMESPHRLSDNVTLPHPHHASCCGCPCGPSFCCQGHLRPHWPATHWTVTEPTAVWHALCSSLWSLRVHCLSGGSPGAHSWYSLTLASVAWLWLVWRHSADHCEGLGAHGQGVGGPRVCGWVSTTLARFVWL